MLEAVLSRSKSRRLFLCSWFPIDQVGSEWHSSETIDPSYAKFLICKGNPISISSNIRRGSSSKVAMNVCCPSIYGDIFHYRSFPHAHPPLGRIERAVPVVGRWVDIVEVVPYYHKVSILKSSVVQRLNLLCPMITPQISSFGTLPCTAKLKAINTHGNHGALNTSNPIRLSRVSGLRRLQMYTRTEESGVPRKAMLKNGAIPRSSIAAKVRR